MWRRRLGVHQSIIFLLVRPSTDATRVPYDRCPSINHLSPGAAAGSRTRDRISEGVSINQSSFSWCGTLRSVLRYVREEVSINQSSFSWCGFSFCPNCSKACRVSINQSSFSWCGSTATLEDLASEMCPSINHLSPGAAEPPITAFPEGP